MGITSRFNSRARVGRDRGLRPSCTCSPCFNSRARVGRDPRRTPPTRRRSRFNSRARVGRDKEVRAMEYIEQVSIHAPAWGATRTRSTASRGETFQFTRPRGARPVSPPRPRGRCSFNSRARVGRDTTRRISGDRALFQFTRPRGARPDKDEAFTALSEVSIHAPAWGATDRGGDLVAGDVVSIHAPAWGATRAGSPASRWRCFNSRARVGRDTRTLPFAAVRRFQFTRPRGARLLLVGEGFPGKVSIHAPAWGATARSLHTVSGP